ncbi:MAG: protease HtpX [Thiotrichaceae bacterium]
MKRVILLLVTNFAVIAVLGLAWNVLDAMFGISQIFMNMGLPAHFGYTGVMALVLGFGGAFISLWMSKGMAKRSMGVQVIEDPQTNQEQWLFDVVQRQAQEVGIEMPEVGIFQSPEPNAFATGARKNSALVAVSQGLLDHMNADEVEAVLGHEMAHVANGDMVTQTLLQGVLNTFVIFLSRVVGFFIDSLLSRGEQRSGFGMGYYISSMVMQMLFGFLATMIVMWFSRWREFHADQGGAQLAGRAKMIAALKRLNEAHATEDLPGEMAAFGIAGGVGSGFKKLMMTHPPLEERIAALEAGSK